MFSVYVAFEVEPIGVNGALEATNAFFFCCTFHRDKYVSEHEGVKRGELFGDCIEGTCCDECGKELTV